MKPSERTLIARLNISQWSARKLDKRVTTETNQAHGATADAGNYNKALLPKAYVQPIQQAATAARAEHMALTAPWLDDGGRILTVEAFEKYTEAMRGHREAFDSAVAVFAGKYDAARDAARARLGDMFDPNDYPPVSDVLRRFSFDFSLMPTPDAGDFRCQLSDSQVAAIQADIETRTRDAMADAMADVWGRVIDTVGKMADKLASYEPPQGRDKPAKGVFRDTLVSNVKDLAELLPLLNVTQDPKLATVAGQLAELAQHDPADLREKDQLRQDTADQAAAILDDVSAYLA